MRNRDAKKRAAVLITVRPRRDGRRRRSSGVLPVADSTKRARARSICDETVIIPVLHIVELSQARQAQLATSQKFHLAREMFEKSAVFSLARLARA